MFDYAYRLPFVFAGMNAPMSCLPRCMAGWKLKLTSHREYNSEFHSVDQLESGTIISRLDFTGC